MPRICEICGRIEEVDFEGHPYDILDVCPECTDNVVNSDSELEQ